jgi:hypothetical protein
VTTPAGFVSCLAAALRVERVKNESPMEEPSQPTGNAEETSTGGIFAGHEKASGSIATRFVTLTSNELQSFVSNRLSRQPVTSKVDCRAGRYSEGILELMSTKEARNSRQGAEFLTSTEYTKPLDNEQKNLNPDVTDT